MTEATETPREFPGPTKSITNVYITLLLLCRRDVYFQRLTYVFSEKKMEIEERNEM